MIKMLQIIKI